MAFFGVENDPAATARVSIQKAEDSGLPGAAGVAGQKGEKCDKLFKRLPDSAEDQLALVIYFHSCGGQAAARDAV